MPLYYFECSGCKSTFRKIMSPEEAQAPLSCGGCLQPMLRTPRPPSTRVVETLDNGVMTKRLERLADAERLFAERNEAVKRNQGG